MPRGKGGARRDNPGLRLETLIHLGEHFYLEAVDQSCAWTIYHGFREDGVPKHQTFHGSLREVAACAARYRCRDLAKGVTSLKELEARIEEAIQTTLKGVKGVHSTIDPPDDLDHHPDHDRAAVGPARHSSPEGN